MEIDNHVCNSWLAEAMNMGLIFMVPYFVSTFSSVAALQDCSADNI